MNKTTRFRRFALGLVGVLVAILVIGAFLFWRSTIPVTPSAFYTPPEPLPPGEPGMLIRTELITDNLPEGAVAWRVLYLSTGVDGEPVAVSGLIAAPAEPATEPRPVIAWAHGTLGVQPACGTSHMPNPFEHIPEVPRLIREGYVLAATDYPGLGTPGVHPYLFGEVAAASVLDSVRAARQMDVGAGERFAVWGHSQGGHSTLWTAQLAASYAPELALVGAAAVSPAADLVGILESSMDRRVGSLLVSMALTAWAGNFPGASLEEIVTPEAIEQIERVSSKCVTTPTAFLLLGELRPPSDFLPDNLTEIDAFERFIEANTPTGPIDVPLLIAHGTIDQVIPFEGSVKEAERRCAAGETVELERYPQDDHNPALDNSAVSTLGWIEDRFAGRPAATTCGG